MARPCKTRRLEGLPKAVLYEPLNAELAEREPREIAIEDFEVVRLVDGYGIHIEEAAKKVGVSRSTAGRMLERCRRAIALGIEMRAPLFLDASRNLELDGGGDLRMHSKDRTVACGLAVAAMCSDIDAEVSRLFGRAELFFVFDDEGCFCECIENPGASSSRFAASKAVAVLKQAGVKRVVAGRFGPEALAALGGSRIEPFLASGLSVRKAQEIFLRK